MARVKIEEVIDHLSSEIRKALEASIKEVLPHENVDSHQLFHAFKRAVGRKCSTWERVPDNYVEY